ncbi:hypothetical protein [Methanococcoides methylutens]|uniref:Uncharacterized protein n=1 Tax=Methanococcoides methylutens MM1 TaxID=1434104 RepID=A0A0E3X044_METMT|nr:hypothetical protein [Methanococcoides methylutens]AKB85299.1 hypothetical protein MCMEM_1246 [Methanococcoides methylutens MM1]
MCNKPKCTFYGEANDINALIHCVIRALDKADMQKEKIEYIRKINRDGNMFDSAIKTSSNYVEFVEIE